MGTDPGPAIVRRFRPSRPGRTAFALLVFTVACLEVPAQDADVLAARLLSVRPEVKMEAALAIARGRRWELADEVARALARRQPVEVRDVLLRSLVHVATPAQLSVLFDHADGLDSRLTLLDPIAARADTDQLLKSLDHGDPRVTAFCLRHLASRRSELTVDEIHSAVLNGCNHLKCHEPWLALEIYRSALTVSAELNDTEQAQILATVLSAIGDELRRDPRFETELANHLVLQALEGKQVERSIGVARGEFPASEWIRGAELAALVLEGPETPLGKSGASGGSALAPASAPTRAEAQAPAPAPATAPSTAPASARVSTQAPARAVIARSPWLRGCELARAGRGDEAVRALLQTRPEALVVPSGRLAARVGGIEAVESFLDCIGAPLTRTAGRSAARELGTAAIPYILAREATAHGELRLALTLLRSEILADQFSQPRDVSR